MFVLVDVCCKATVNCYPCVALIPVCGDFRVMCSGDRSASEQRCRRTEAESHAQIPRLPPSPFVFRWAGVEISAEGLQGSIAAWYYFLGKGRGDVGAPNFVKSLEVRFVLKK
eukprot:RCo053844